MLYYFAKMIMWPTLQIYFRRIVFTGREKIPAKEPVILIVNHSASFLDAILLGSFLHRPLYYMARSDVFRKKAAERILRAVHMIPIFNAEHSKEDLHRNVETFREGEQALSEKHVLVIFPEGISRQERILLPLKKGTARVAFHTETSHNFSLGLRVIPVGINYHFHRFRSDILISIGDPTVVKDYESTYRENPNKAINQLTRDLQTKFAETMIYVDQPERTDLINHLLVLFRNDREHFGDHLKKVPVLKMEKEVCNTVSRLSAEDAESFKTQLNNYLSTLKKHGLHDQSVIGRYRSVVIHFLLLLIGLPLFIAGAVTSAIPVYTAKWMADRTVTRIDFYTSVSSVGGGFIYLLWWMILIGVAAAVGKTWFWILVLTAPVSLYIGLYWREAWQSWIAHIHYLVLKSKNPALLSHIKSQRDALRLWEIKKDTK